MFSGTWRAGPCAIAFCAPIACRSWSAGLARSLDLAVKLLAHPMRRVAAAVAMARFVSHEFPCRVLPELERPALIVAALVVAKGSGTARQTGHPFQFSSREKPPGLPSRGFEFITTPSVDRVVFHPFRSQGHSYRGRDLGSVATLVLEGDLHLRAVCASLSVAAFSRDSVLVPTSPNTV